MVRLSPFGLGQLHRDFFLDASISTIDSTPFRERIAPWPIPHNRREQLIEAGLFLGDEGYFYLP